MRDLDSIKAINRVATSTDTAADAERKAAIERKREIEPVEPADDWLRKPDPCRTW